MAKPKITPSQQKKIDLIKESFFCNHSYANGEYEIKEFEVDATCCEYFVSVSITVGMINDEGTAAEVFARDSGLFFIYRGGRVTEPNSNKSLKSFYANR